MDTNIGHNELEEKMKKVTWLLLIGMLTLVGCNRNEEAVVETVKQQAGTVAHSNKEKNTEEAKEKTIEKATEGQGPSIQVMNEWEKYFDGWDRNEIGGCIVLYASHSDCYYVYNDTMATVETSPCSTFKIISTLLGLEQGVIYGEGVRNWNGTSYWNDNWNKDMSLKEAFKTSWVWYYRQVIDALDPTYIEDTLKTIGYGNADISGDDTLPIGEERDLLGFWLESSLKISPFEQVGILKSIFEGQTSFKQENIEKLEALMAYEDIETGNLYGKTGSGYKDGICQDAWFVGKYENTDGPYYFAVYLKGGKRTTGMDAKEIARQLLEDLES